MNYLKYFFYIAVFTSVCGIGYKFYDMQKDIIIRDGVVETLNQSLITQSEINKDDMQKQKSDLESIFSKEKIEMRLQYDKSKTIDINSNRIYF